MFLQNFNLQKALASIFAVERIVSPHFKFIMKCKVHYLKMGQSDN